MKENKINNFQDLSKIKFDNLNSNKEISNESSNNKIVQNLEAHFSNKGRAGKTVTIIKGFKGEKSDLKVFAKAIKNKFSVGGSIKNNEIIIQGNFRDKIIFFINSLGHKVKRVGG